MNKAIDYGIFEFAYRCAMADAVQRGAYPHHQIGAGEDENRNTHGDYRYEPTRKNEIVLRYPQTMKTVKAFVDDIIFAGFSSSCEYNQHFEETSKEIYSLMKKDGYYEFSFGNIQKLINMSIKYMYILGYNNPELRNKFRFCHCPIDVQITKKLVQIKFDYLNDPDAFRKDGTLCAKAAANIPDVWQAINCIAQSAPNLSWSGLSMEHMKLYFDMQKEFDEIRKNAAPKYGMNLIELDYFIWE